MPRVRPANTTRAPKDKNAGSPCKVHDDGVILEGVVRSGDDLCELAYDVSAVLLTRRRAGVGHKETGLRLRHLGLEGNAAGSSHTHARSTQWKTSELFPPPSSLAAFPAPPATWPRSCSTPSSPVSALETAHVAFFFFRRRKRPPSSNLRTSNFKCEIASPHFTFCYPSKNGFISRGRRDVHRGNARARVAAEGSRTGPEVEVRASFLVFGPRAPSVAVSCSGIPGTLCFQRWQNLWKVSIMTPWHAQSAGVAGACTLTPCRAWCRARVVGSFSPSRW